MDTKLKITAVIIICLLISLCFGKYSGGTGEPDDPYQIADFNDLMTLQANLNDWDKNFVLTADIDLDPNLPGCMVFTTAVIAYDTDDESNGFQGERFSGVFNGDGHAIRNLIIDTNGISSDYLGLFGYIDGNSVSNLGVEEVKISGGPGSFYIGGLCGCNKNGLITNSYATSSITGNWSLGGLCGYNIGTITSCYSVSSIIGSDGLGSLCGYNSKGLISNCYAKGSVTAGYKSKYLGGVCGTNSGAISNCYSLSTVSSGVGSEYIGGLCGFNNYKSGCISGCYFLDTAGPNNGLGTPLTDYKLKQQASFVGWDFTGEKADGTSDFWIIESGSYPKLTFVDAPYEFQGAGMQHDPYLIYDANDLGSVWQKPGCHYKLVNDINLTGIQWSSSVIGYFYGIFDGDDYIISNLSINGGSYLGLFGQLLNDGCVQNLGIEDVNIAGGDYTHFIGSLCGYDAQGVISNCYATGTVKGNEDIGGLCGYNYRGIVTECYTTVNVAGGYLSHEIGGICGHNSSGTINNCYTNGTVTGYRTLGGLCGRNTGSITNCFSVGAVNGYYYLGGLCGYNSETITNCYSSAYVSGASYLGGFCGFSPDGMITNCYFLDIAGPDNGIGAPLTDYEMMQQKSFVGLDFAGENLNGTCSFWIIESDSYPKLAFFDDSFGPHKFYGEGTQLDPYLILEANDLGAIWQKPECHYKLINDIDLAGIQWSTAVIPYFYGSFDGTDHIISNLSISGGLYLGLFGRLINKSSVQYLGVEEVNIIGGDDSGSLGSICGYNIRGTIKHCYSTGSIVAGRMSSCLGGVCGDNDYGNISNCSSIVCIIGRSSLGGICGGNYHGTIADCRAIVTVNIPTGKVRRASYLGGICGSNYQGTITDCCSQGSVTGGHQSQYLGGLCGSNTYGTIRNCHSAVAVNILNGEDPRVGSLGGLCGHNENSIIINCYSTGFVAGGDDSGNLGGLCGRSENGIIKDCYSTGSVIGGYDSRNIGGLCGYSTSGIIIDCYSTGFVAGGDDSDDLGGFCGKNNGTVKSCFWDVVTSGMDISSGGIGLTTTEMQDINTFLDAGWDFVGEVVNGTEDIWVFLFADDYPRLRWENNLPVADAGDDREAYAWLDGFAEVSLNASGSNDADGHELSYHWSWQIDSVVYQAEGVNPTITLPAGEHTIELTVNDGIEDSQPDSVVITVVEPIQCDSRIAPRVIHRNSSGPKNVIVWLQLPASISIDQISESDPITLLEAGLDSKQLRIYERGRGSNANVNVFAYFDTADLLEAIDGTGRIDLTAVGNLTTGQYFFATDRIVIR